jgi:hypothetical protein
LFTTAAAVWLVIMENALKHTGYVTRAWNDSLIAAVSVSTLLIFRGAPASKLRYVAVAGAALFIWWGVSAVIRILESPHFEGFVLIIGAALVVQGILVILLAFPLGAGLTPRSHA